MNRKSIDQWATRLNSNVSLFKKKAYFYGHHIAKFVIAPIIYTIKVLIE